MLPPKGISDSLSGYFISHLIFVTASDKFLGGISGSLSGHVISCLILVTLSDKLWGVYLSTSSANLTVLKWALIDNIDQGRTHFLALAVSYGGYIWEWHVKIWTHFRFYSCFTVRSSQKTYNQNKKINLHDLFILILVVVVVLLVVCCPCVIMYTTQQQQYEIISTTNNNCKLTEIGAFSEVINVWLTCPVAQHQMTACKARHNVKLLWRWWFWMGSHFRHCWANSWLAVTDSFKLGVYLKGYLGTSSHILYLSLHLTSTQRVYLRVHLKIWVPRCLGVVIKEFFSLCIRPMKKEGMNCEYEWTFMQPTGGYCNT